jgi:hypothetical protein
MSKGGKAAWLDGGDWIRQTYQITLMVLCYQGFGAERLR